MRVLGEAYTPEDEEDSAVAEVTSVWVYQARYRIPLTKALAGENSLHFQQPLAFLGAGAFLQHHAVRKSGSRTTDSRMLQ